MKLLYTYVFCLLVCLLCIPAQAQNSMVGDGFGGRLWYRPFNYTVGSYSAYSTCGDSNQLYAWGFNGFGQLGNAGTTSSALPVKVIGMSRVKYYSAGYCVGVIKSDKTGWVFGLQFTSTPKKAIDSVKFVNAGALSCSFIKEDGTVWSLGTALPGGTFGNGDTSSLSKSYSTPQKMLKISTAVRVANGTATTLVLLKDSTVMACGININGGVGISSNKSDTFLVPRKITSLTGIVDIKASAYFNLALDKNGDVYEWGNTTSFPTKLTTLKNIVAISARNDGDHFLALDKDRNCYAWGKNAHGAFGSGNTKSNNTPQLVATDVVDIMAGETFSYIVKSDSSLWASGSSLSNSSIWLNLSDTQRFVFTRLNPQVSPVNLCPLKIVPVELLRSYTICEGDSVQTPQRLYKDAGVYQDTVFSDKGDTILVTKMTVFKRSYETQNYVICEGDSLSMNKKKYAQQGTYYDTFLNYLGCDSVVTLYLKVRPKSRFSQTVEICQGRFFQVGSNNYTFQGTYYDTLYNYQGCDSVIITTLKIKPKSTFIQELRICQGQSIQVGSKQYAISGTYIDTLTNYWGCDSLITTILQVNPQSAFSQTVEICQGQSYTVGGKQYTNAGTYIDTLRNYYACDSVVNTTVKIKPISTFTQTIEICDGKSYLIGNKTHSKKGVYMDTLSNYLGCDSIVMTTINLRQKSMRLQDILICQGDSFKVGNNTYVQAGVYSDTLMNYTGCDSIVISTLKIKTKSEALKHVEICNGQSYQIGNNAYNKAGTYYDTLFNYLGCDSIVTVQLTMTICGFQLYNVFTPNGDGVNDLFEISGEAELSYDIFIYDRWGVLVFKSINAQIKDRSKFWNGNVMNDGNPCSGGTYYYLFYPHKKSYESIHGVMQLIR